MNKYVKATIVGLSLLTAPISYASVVSMPGNITLDPLQGGDPTLGDGNFRNTFSFVQWWETASGPTSLSSISATNFGDFSLQGYGELVPAFEPGMFECSGCELTFNFGDIGLGLIELAGTDTEQDLFNQYQRFSSLPTFEEFLQDQVNKGTIFLNAQGEFAYLGLDTSLAYLNIYLDYTPDLVIDRNNILGNAPYAGGTSSELWLSLSFIDTVFNPDDVFDGVFGLSFADTSFSLDATGGMAMDSFVNAQDISWEDIGLEALSDVIGFGLTAQFNEAANGSLEIYSSVGAGEVRGNVVSAPSTIALFGLALIGIGAINRRRKA